MGERWKLTKESLPNFVHLAEDKISAGEYMTVEIVPKRRTVNQNALSFKMYSEIAGKVGDQTVDDVRAECKLTVGVPIMRAADEKFCAEYDALIRNRFTYEEKLKLMVGRMDFPVTRLMGKPEFSQYVDDVIRKYAMAGIHISPPSYD